MCSPVRVLFQKQWLLWQLTMMLIIHAISLFLPQAPSIVELGKVCGWRNNERTRSAIYCLLPLDALAVYMTLRARTLQRTSRQEQGPACQSNCLGKHTEKKTAGPPASLCCLPHAEDALTHADWAVYDPLAREMERERVDCYASLIQMRWHVRPRARASSAY